jgi:hypothetical protein
MNFSRNCLFFLKRILFLSFLFVFLLLSLFLFILIYFDLFLTVLPLLIFLILVLIFKIRNVFILLILFVESSDMKGPFSFGDQWDLINYRDKDIDDSLWVFFCEGRDQKLFISFFNEKRSRLFGVGCQDYISNGNNITLALLSVLKFEGLSWIQNFAEEHWLLIL